MYIYLPIRMVKSRKVRSACSWLVRSTANFLSWLHPKRMGLCNFRLRMWNRASRLPTSESYFLFLSPQLFVTFCFQFNWASICTERVKERRQLTPLSAFSLLLSRLSLFIRWGICAISEPLNRVNSREAKAWVTERNSLSFAQLQATQPME